MDIRVLRQPKGVFFIAFTQMWESFSFFGMRALLVLYLISAKGYSPQDAFILYTLYIAFVKIFASLGGYVIDRILGCKRGVLIGGFFILIGHLLLTFAESSICLFFSLGNIVCGSALFRVSIQTLLGFLYHQEDERREKGFTLLYVGMNFGGLAAAVLCGFVAEIYGWHAGFGLAAFGMGIGMGVFAYFPSSSRLFTETKAILKYSSFFIFTAGIVCSVGIGALLILFRTVQSFALPIGSTALVGIFFYLSKKMDKSLLFSIGVSFLLLIAFFTAEELWGSLLMVFSQTHIDRTIFGIEIPSAVVAAINPLTIIVFGPIIADFKLSLRTKLSFAFLFLSFAFFILYIASQIDHPSILYLVVGLFSIAGGELFIAPSVLSFASESAPQGHSGMMIGVTTLAFAMGSLLSGELASIRLNSGTMFFLIGIVSFGIFLLVHLSFKRFHPSRSQN